jgi:hypothetical protein
MLNTVYFVIATSSPHSARVNIDYSVLREDICTLSTTCLWYRVLHFLSYVAFSPNSLLFKVNNEKLII